MGQHQRRFGDPRRAADSGHSASFLVADALGAQTEVASRCLGAHQDRQSQEDSQEDIQDLVHQTHHLGVQTCVSHEQQPSVVQTAR